MSVVGEGTPASEAPIVEAFQSSSVLSSSVRSKERSFSDRSVVLLHMARKLFVSRTCDPNPSARLLVSAHACCVLNGLLREIDLISSNVQEQVWTWANDGEEYFYDKNEWVLVRVEDEQWNDISPSPPSERRTESTTERKSPYSITASMSHVVLSLHFSFKTILSNRWASGSHGSAEEGSIKWKYQSRFDEADGDSNDQLDLLAKATAEAVLAVETPGFNIDTAAIFTKFAAWIPQNNSKISSRTHTIGAHRHYLKLIHHIPLAIDPSNFDYVVKSLSDIEWFSNANYKELLNVAMKVCSRWLLKEVVSRISADPLLEEEYEIWRSFSSSNTGELLRGKRAELRDILEDIDQRVLLIQQRKNSRRMPDERTIAFAAAALRDEISRLFKSH
ncbi:MAG: hypothetical protein Q9175_004689 [Cornicularia normoerica]